MRQHLSCQARALGMQKVKKPKMQEINSDFLVSKKQQLQFLSKHMLLQVTVYHYYMSHKPDRPILHKYPCGDAVALAQAEKCGILQSGGKDSFCSAVFIDAATDAAVFSIYFVL